MKLSAMMNIGKGIENELECVGITTAEQLGEMGSEKAFTLMKKQFPHLCVCHLYCLEGAVTGIRYNMLSQERKAELKEFFDSLK